MARPQKFRHSREALNAPEVAAKLAGLVLDIEALRAKRKQIDDQIAAGYDAVDDAGFEKKFVRQTIALRAKEEGARSDDEQGLEAYEFAVEKGVSLVRTRRERNSYAEATGAEPKLSTPHDPETGEILTREQPETASQSASGVSAVAYEYAGTSSDENPAHSGIAQGRGSGRSVPVQVSKPAPATIPHSPAVLPGKADKTSEAARSSPASLAPPNGTKHTNTGYGSDPLNNAPSAEADQTGAVTSLEDAPAPATPFDNPRCKHSDTCHLAHSKDSCHDCLTAWSQRPKDEQVRLWSEAVRAA